MGSRRQRRPGHGHAAKVWPVSDAQGREKGEGEREGERKRGKVKKEKRGGRGGWPVPQLVATLLGARRSAKGGE